MTRFWFGFPAKLKDLDEAEQQIQEGLRRLGEASIQAWAKSADKGSPPPACPECKCSMRHRGLARRKLVTVHGMIEYARPRQRCDRCGKESYVEDTALCFGPHGVSWEVARRVGRLGSLLPSHEMTRQLLLDDYGIELSEHTIEEIVNQGGRDAAGR
ncbi:MAG: hypothetical protein ACUVUC_15835 [Thermoguttaceae bacterium]